MSEAAVAAPTVIVPGFMKCGSTAVHSWLTEQPEYAPSVKEPNLLDRDDFDPRCPDEYLATLGHAPGIATIDASARYLDPRVSALVAERLQRLNPEARILVVVRDPIARAVSHVAHDVRRGRLRASTAGEYSRIIVPGSTYVERSRYGTAIEPWVRRFDPDRLLVLPLEQGTSARWKAILRHVGLPERPLPVAVHENRAAELPSYSAAMRVIVDRTGGMDLSPMVPSAVRRLAKRLLLRSAVAAPTVDDVRTRLAAEVAATLADEWNRFEELTVACVR